MPYQRIKNERVSSREALWRGDRRQSGHECPASASLRKTEHSFQGMASMQCQCLKTQQVIVRITGDKCMAVF